jgi:hypothetical protein
MKLKRNLAQTNSLKTKFTVILVFIVSAVFVIGMLFFRGDTKNLAQEIANKEKLEAFWKVYETNSKLNEQYLNELEKLYETLDRVSADKANLVGFYGDKLKNQIAKIENEKSSLKLDATPEINKFGEDILNTILKEEIYLKNSIETTIYFTCMVEKKTGFNLNWQSFESQYGNKFIPSINNIRTKDTKDYFLNYSKTAKKSADELKYFEFCFEDKFYAYKNESFQKAISQSQDQLNYISFLYDKLTNLIDQEGKEVEMITLIEQIEQVNLKKLPIISKEFDQNFIILPSQKIFQDNTNLNFSETRLNLESRYQELVKQIKLS